MAFKRPGVYVEESLLQNNPDFFPSQSAAAFVGVASRGPTTPTLVESWLQFQRLYGGFTGTNQALAHALFQFYNNGGRNAWIVRATGVGAALALRTLKDRQSPSVDVLKVEAANTGAWANSVYVEIVDTPMSGRFNLIVRHGGTTDNYVVERWSDLALDPNDGRYAPTLVNSLGAGSSYIRITDLFNHADGTFNPAVHIPAVSTTAGGDVLAAGVDGAAPDNAKLLTTVQQLEAVEDFLTLNLPDVTDSTLVNQVITWVENQGSVFLVVDCKAGRTPAEAIADASTYTKSSYAAVYYPRLRVADPSNTTPGSTRLIAPGGAVIGQYAATDSSRGTHKAPAGVNNRLSGVVALETKALDTDLDALNVAHINAIKVIPGVGYCIFGARTLKRYQVDRYVNVRRTLITLRMALLQATRFAAFEPNEEMLWSQLESICERILMELWQEGGLRGETPDQAFFIRCDALTNTTAVIDNGEVHIEVGVALQTPAEFIVLKIGQYEAGSTITEEA